MKLAFLFPGQGSQSVGMGADVYAAFPAAAKTMDAADDLLGYKLTTLCFYGPEESLRDTSITQPAMFVTSVATLQVLHEAGISASAAAGHSVGEYAAAVAAGAMTWQTALTLVSERATLMRQAAEANPGAMAAVFGLEASALEQICAEVEGSGAGAVEPANINGAGQIVVSGEAAAVDVAAKVALERGARRVVPLPVSGGFHSRLMVEAAQSMRGFLAEATITQPQIPLVANVTGDYATTASELAANLASQIDHPVHWAKSMQRLIDDGYDTFVEVGPGAVLTGLMKRMSPAATLYTTQDASALRQTLSALGQGANQSS